VASNGTLCAECWRDISFIAPPYCRICGLPFEFDLGSNVVCGACSRQRPAFDRARAAFIYNDASRNLILSFKHADRTHAAPAYAGWMKTGANDLIDGADIVAPVPLHWTRLFSRRYNQAALLAASLARFGPTTYRPDLLLRRKRTPSQGHMSRTQRRLNVQGAFRVRPRLRGEIAAKRILLIDDVLTTGATVQACAHTLLRAGAGAVDVLTLARVVRTE